MTQHNLNRKKISKYIQLLEQKSLFIVSTEKKNKGILIQNNIFKTAIETIILKDILSSTKTLHSSIYPLCSGENYLYIYSPTEYSSIDLKESEIVGIFYLGHALTKEDLAVLQHSNLTQEIFKFTQLLQQGQQSLLNTLSNSGNTLIHALQAHSNKNGNV